MDFSLHFTVDEMPGGKFAVSARDGSGAVATCVYRLGRRDHAEEYRRLVPRYNRRARTPREVAWPRPPGHMTP